MSIVLEVIAPRLLGPAVVVAVALIVKGYRDIGDGFSAGVIVALAIALRYIVLGVDGAERSLPLLRHAPATAASGLLIGLAVGFAPVAVGDPPFTHVPKPGEHVMHFGTFELLTAVAFDVGVFMLVIGALTMVLHHLGRLVEASRA